MTRILYVGELPIQHSASLEMEILPSQILIVVWLYGMCSMPLFFVLFEKIICILWTTKSIVVIWYEAESGGEQR